MKRFALLLSVVISLSLSVFTPWLLASSSVNQMGNGFPLPSGTVVTASAFLEPTGDSAATGTALLDYDPKTGQTMVTLLVKGLAPGSSHAAHIHLNTCDGPVAFTLQNVGADQNGFGFSRTFIKSQINVTDWWINVHRDATLPSPGITCGKVRGQIAVN